MVVEDKLAVKILLTLNIFETQKVIPPEEMSAGILGLVTTVKNYDKDDFEIEGKKKIVKDDSETGYLVDRLIKAYKEGRIREQYMEELQAEEKYELLSKIV